MSRKIRVLYQFWKVIILINTQSVNMDEDKAKQSDSNFASENDQEFQDAQENQDGSSSDGSEIDEEKLKDIMNEKDESSSEESKEENAQESSDEERKELASDQKQENSQRPVSDRVESTEDSSMQNQAYFENLSAEKTEISENSLVSSQLLTEIEKIKNQKRMSEDFPNGLGTGQNVSGEKENPDSLDEALRNNEVLAKSEHEKVLRKPSAVKEVEEDSASSEEKAKESKPKEMDPSGSDEDEDDDDDVDLNDDDEDDDDGSLSEGEKKRLLEEELQNESEDNGNEDSIDSNDEDDDDSDKESDDDDGCGSNKDSDSVLEEDIANRSLNAEDEDQLVVIDKINYLKYVSDRFNQQTDILEIVDKNERSFKQLAEKMIHQTSYLIQNQQQLDEEIAAPKAKRLIHCKQLQAIGESFHSQSKNGFPYAISALEDFTCVGSSDGGLRFYDQHERELRCLQDKTIKNIPVMSLDMIRMRENSIFVISGHQKGQLVLYEVLGLKDNGEILPTLNGKHLKTVSDVHEAPVVSVKFFGESNYSQKKISVVSSDLEGIVYLTYYSYALMGYQVTKQCFMKKRVGPTFSIAPFILNPNATFRYIQDTDSAAAPMTPYQIDIEKRQQTQLIAFGSLSRILIAQIIPSQVDKSGHWVPPSAKELLFIDKPDYIEQGTVPYLDWGYGLSPCCRDKSYPMLAIAWGKILQLALYTNFQSAQTSQTPLLQYDGFYICEHSIDSCFFLTESIIFVLVNKREVRILYTQNFTPGLFDETYQLNDLTGQQGYGKNVTRLQKEQDRKLYFMQLREKFVGQVSTYAEKDKGYKLLQNDEIKFKDNAYSGNNILQKSNFNFNPTICKNKENVIVALGKNSIGQGQLLNWEEYLDLIRKTSNEGDCWLMLLRAALDIYNGRLTGLAGIPDHKETREHMLREEMKELLRQNIDSCIKEFQEGPCVQTKTLRVALEFCIRVNALDHLFGEVFGMFSDAGMEQRFFENLEPFILSGKFKQTKIPKELFERLIEYYRQKDTELLEKVLLNLDLSQYKNILQVRHICETEFLTSALIHILTNLFDSDNENTVCLQLLCSLFNMMQKSKFVKEKSDIFKLLYYDYQYTPPGSEKAPQIEKILSQGDQQIVLTRDEKLEIEQSKTYIGYKLMWVMKMFLEGKKFPQGTLSSFKWRIYVYDIVRFATNSQFLAWFLEFDPDCFFKLMKNLYLDQEPYEYIQSQTGFIEMYKDQIQGLDSCMTHTQIVDALQHQVQTYIANDRSENGGYLSQRGECALNSFIFFVAQISRKPQVPVPSQLGSFVVKEHLKFYRKLMKIPEITNEVLTKLSSVGANNQTQTQQQIQSKKSLKQAAKQDKLTRLYLALIKKNEKDVISLLQRCENDLDDDEIVNLWHDAERSPMFKVRVYLLQLQNNHKDCLETYFKVPAIREDVFVWLNELENRQKHLSGQSSAKESINKLILNYVPRLVSMDASQAIKLVEQWLMAPDAVEHVDHLKIVEERLKGDIDLIFKYLNTLLTDKEPVIIEEHQNLMIGVQTTSSSLRGVTANGSGYAKYKELMLRFVKILLLIIGEKRYRGMLAEFVRKKYVPIEESYKIINDVKNSNLDTINSLGVVLKKKSTLSKPAREREINESLAILCRRQGQSEKAIDLYIQVLKDLSETEVISALYISQGVVPFDDPTASNNNQHIMKFDSLINDIVKICDKVGGTEEQQEALWLHAIREIYQMKLALFEDGNKNGEKKEKKDQKRFSTFHMIRIQFFMRRMAEHVSIPKIIQFFEDMNQGIRYQECRGTFEDKMRTEQHHENILNNAATLLLKDLNADFSILKHLHKRGVTNEKEKCDHCKRGIQSRWDPQPVCVYSCGHIFHQRCAQNNNFKCTKCHNEYEEIETIINQRGVRRIGKSGPKKDQEASEAESFSTASGAERSSSNSRKDKDDFNPSATRVRSATTVEAASFKKTGGIDLEREQKLSLLDNFNIQMTKFEAEMNDKIVRKHLFERRK